MFWCDTDASNYDRIEKASLTGSSRQLLSETRGQSYFGLTIDETYIYVTGMASGQVKQKFCRYLEVSIASQFWYCLPYRDAVYHIGRGLTVSTWGGADRVSRRWSWPCQPEVKPKNDTDNTWPICGTLRRDMAGDIKIEWWWSIYYLITFWSKLWLKQNNYLINVASQRTQSNKTKIQKQ